MGHALDPASTEIDAERKCQGRLACNFDRHKNFRFVAMPMTNDERAALIARLNARLADTTLSPNERATISRRVSQLTAIQAAFRQKADLAAAIGSAGQPPRGIYLIDDPAPFQPPHVYRDFLKSIADLPLDDPTVKCARASAEMSLRGAEELEKAGVFCQDNSAELHLKNPEADLNDTGPQEESSKHLAVEQPKSMTISQLALQFSGRRVAELVLNHANNMSASECLSAILGLTHELPPPLREPVVALIDLFAAMPQEEQYRVFSADLSVKLPEIVNVTKGFLDRRHRLHLTEDEAITLFNILVLNWAVSCHRSASTRSAMQKAAGMGFWKRLFSR